LGEAIAPAPHSIQRPARKEHESLKEMAGRALSREVGWRLVPYSNTGFKLYATLKASKAF